MFFRGVLLLSLAAVALAAVPVVDKNKCTNGQKYIDRVGSAWLQECKVKEIAGEIVRQSRIIGCVDFDGNEVSIGKSFMNYQNAAKTYGFRMACKVDNQGRITRAADACYIDGKFIEAGKEAVIGQHSLCTCVTEPSYNIKCKPFNIFDDRK